MSERRIEYWTDPRTGGKIMDGAGRPMTVMVELPKNTLTNEDGTPYQAGATTKYRKKPIVIEAVQLTELTFIVTLEGTMQGNPGDWLITGTAGEKYPCKDSIFREVYEPVED